MRDGESVSDEESEEADLVIECLPRGDLGGPHAPVKAGTA